MLVISTPLFASTVTAIDISIGSATTLVEPFIKYATHYSINLYGKQRDVLAYDGIVMLKTLKSSVLVAWVYRKSNWVALVTTDLDWSVEQIIEYYGARWKIESGFKQIKQEFAEFIIPVN